jgi:hypothetical protein
MEEKQARWHLIAGGVAHRKWRRHRGESLGRVTRWGERRPWCAPCASLSGGKGERRGWGSIGKEACEQWGPKGKERGGSDTGTRARFERRHGCREQRGVLCDKTRRVRHNAAATREWHTWAPPQTVSVGHAVIATRHVWCCQTSHRNDVKSGNSNSLTYMRLTFLLVFSFFFSFLQKTVLPLLLG